MSTQGKKQYKGYSLIRRYDRRYSRWFIVAMNGWTVATANTIREAKALIDKGID